MMKTTAMVVMQDLVRTMLIKMVLVMLLIMTGIIDMMPVPGAARSKAQVCRRSPAEIVGSNPTGGMDVSVVSVECCQVEVSATS